MTTSCGLFPASPMMMATSMAWPLPVSDNDPYRSTTIWLVAVNKPLLSSRSIKLFRHSLAHCMRTGGPIPILKYQCTNHYPHHSDCRSVKWSGTTSDRPLTRALRAYCDEASISTSHLSANARPAHSSGSGGSPDVHRRTAIRLPLMVAKSIQIGDEHGHLDDIATQPGSNDRFDVFEGLNAPDLAHQPGSHRSVGKPELPEVKTMLPKSTP